MRGNHLGAMAALLAIFYFVIGAAAARDSYTGVHTIGVVSALSDDVRIKSIYDHNHVPLFSLFSGHEPDDSIEVLHTDWHIDKFIFDEISSALGDRFVVKSVDAGALPDLSVLSFSEERASLKRRVLALPSDAGIDAYVIVYPITVRAGGSGGFDQTGLEVTHFFGGFGGAGTVGATGNFRLSVLEAKTGERIDYATAGILEFCKATLLANDVGHLTAAQKAIIRRELFGLVHRNFPAALRSAGLISSDESRRLAAVPLPADLSQNPSDVQEPPCTDSGFPP